MTTREYITRRLHKEYTVEINVTREFYTILADGTAIPVGYVTVTGSTLIDTEKAIEDIHSAVFKDCK